MSFQLTTLVIPYVLSVILTVGLTIYGIRIGRSKGFDNTTIAFIGFVSMGALWSVARIGEMTATGFMMKHFWTTMIYVGYPGSGIAMLAFGLSYTSRDKYLTVRNLLALAVIPLLAIVVAATNPVHEILWTGDVDLHEETGLYIYDRELSIWFTLNMVYNVSLALTGIYLVVRMAIRSSYVYRKQSVALVIGALSPIVLGVMFGTGTTPLIPSFVDLTPVGFGITGLCFAYGVFRFRLLDVVPVARNTVVESMRDGFVVLDTKDRVVDCNDTALEVFDTNSEAVGESIHDLLPSAGDLVDDHDHGSQTETEITIDVTGDQQFLAATVSSLYDDDKLIGCLLILRDITDRRAIQKRYQALIENSSDLILVLNEDGRITYASPSIRNVTGVSPDMVEGQNTFDLIHYDDVETLREVFDDLLANSGDKIRFEYRTIDADGEIVVMEGVGQNMLANPFVEGIVVNARDITERKERERELERTNDQLQQFASVVSHDLRNPLNVARGHLQIAAETGDEESLYEIEVSLDRMEAIIGDVLTLAKQGQPIGETEPVSLESLAGDAWAHVATDEATLVFDLDESTVVEADPTRLMQLFENCFRNAHEHVGEDVTVTVGFDEDDESIYVEDDGPGIPEDSRDEVFESGYTTNEDGTGFGLAIVSEVAEAHGWKVAIEDGTDGGARFEFHGVDRSSPIN